VSFAFFIQFLFKFKISSGGDAHERPYMAWRSLPCLSITRWSAEWPVFCVRPLPFQPSRITFADAASGSESQQYDSPYLSRTPHGRQSSRLMPDHDGVSAGEFLIESAEFIGFIVSPGVVLGVKIQHDIFLALQRGERKSTISASGNSKCGASVPVVELYGWHIRFPFLAF